MLNWTPEKRSRALAMAVSTKNRSGRYSEIERREAIARERPRARVLECATPKFTDGATLAARTRCSLTIVRRASRRNPGW